MPLYEYQCDNCGEHFEMIQKFSDEPIATHPKCGGKVHRLLSAPALQFKGSGWYVNDYAKSPPPGAAAASKTPDGSAAKSDPAPSGKSDGASSTPAATTTTTDKKS
jgi:putative FmdB family regulatory protein